jgi:hypothetical protein
MRDSSFQQIIGAIARPYTDVPALLREQESLSPASEMQESRFVLDERIAAKSQEAILRIDPTAPHKVVEPMTASLYAASANLNTEGARPYIRLPSFPQASPYLILYFRGLASDIQHLVAIDMQVFSAGGLVRIEATGSPVVTLVTHSGTNGAPVTVTVTFTINAGYGAVLLKRVGETGFDWFGASLLTPSDKPGKAIAFGATSFSQFSER